MIADVCILRRRRARATQLARGTTYTVPECEAVLVAIGAREINPEDVLDAAAAGNVSLSEALRRFMRSAE